MFDKHAARKAAEALELPWSYFEEEGEILSSKIDIEPGEMGSIISESPEVIAEYLGKKRSAEIVEGVNTLAGALAEIDRLENELISAVAENIIQGSPDLCIVPVDEDLALGKDCDCEHDLKTCPNAAWFRKMAREQLEEGGKLFKGDPFSLKSLHPPMWRNIQFLRRLADELEFGTRYSWHTGWNSERLIKGRTHKKHTGETKISFWINDHELQNKPLGSETERWPKWW